MSAAHPSPDTGLMDTTLLLGRALARLCAMQGHAVPVNRFTMAAAGAHGAPLQGLDLPTRAVELWRTAFPGGSVQALAQPPGPGDMPVLWLAAQAGRGAADTTDTTATDPAAPDFSALSAATEARAAGPVLPATGPGGGVLIVRGVLADGRVACVDAAGAALELDAAQAATGRWLQLRVAAVEAPAAATERVAQRPRTAGQWFRFALLRRRRVFLEGALASVTINLLAIASAFYAMQVYDRVVPTQGYATLWVLTAGVAMAVLIELAMRQVRARMVERGCKAIDEELSSVFFGHALAIRMDQRPKTVGTFAAQIRHFEMVRNFMTSSTLFVLADAPFALIFIGVIALIGGPVAVVPAVVLVLALTVGLLVRKRIARFTQAHMEESNRKNGLLIEAVDGVESVKAASAEWKTLDRWRQLTRVLARDELAIRDATSLSQNLTHMLQQVSNAAMIFVGAYAIGNGNLTLGGLIACTIIAGRALGPVTQVAGLIVQWEHARVALKGLDAIMALPADTDGDQPPVVPDHCQGRLRLEGVNFGYSPQQPALSVEGLTISPGERVAVVGSVGSGKSSLIKVLSGLFRPQQGRAFLDDVDLAHLAPAYVREHVGYLPQDVRLFQGTLRDNLALGLPSPTDEQLLAAARRTGLDKVIAAHPLGLGIEISEGGRGLSVGQRQLVGLTRLVLASPRIMLLDEPTASMDPTLEATVAAQVFATRPADSTLVVVTHKPSMLRHFTRILVLDRGRVVADGPRDRILAQLRGAGGAPAEGLPAPSAERAAA
jgi:ATP-binding cassette, subfamily C, bacterial LapB